LSLFDSLQTKKDQKEMRAVAQKPHDAVVKFDTIEMYTASRGPPCVSTALVKVFKRFF